MQNKVEVTTKELIIKPQGINKIASLKSKLVIALDHVQGASLDEGILNDYKGIREPGTTLPGYWAGTFKHNGEKTFFNVSRKDKPVVIQLKDEAYTRLVLGVENPEKLVDKLNNI